MSDAAPDYRAYQPAAAPPRAAPAVVAGFPQSAPPARASARLKRVFDFTAAGLAIAGLSPLLLAIAAAIRLQDGGPSLFRQTRTGLGGAPFEILKFRTMTVMETGDTAEPAIRRDPRVTPLGALLRRTSLDELPQLFNVLYGDMSLVGPRPHPRAMDREYEKLIPAYRARWRSLPGITGYAQAMGFRGEVRQLSDMEMRVWLDVEYARRRSFAFDLYLLARTVRRLPFDDMAY